MIWMKKQKRLRKNSSQSIDEQNQNIQSHYQRFIPISIDHLSSTHKRRRSTTINQQSDLFPNNQHLIYNQNILPIQTPTSRKRTIQNDHFIQEYDQHVG